MTVQETNIERILEDHLQPEIDLLHAKIRSLQEEIDLLFIRKNKLLRIQEAAKDE